MQELDFHTLSQAPFLSSQPEPFLAILNRTSPVILNRTSPVILNRTSPVILNRTSPVILNGAGGGVKNLEAEHCHPERQRRIWSSVPVSRIRFFTSFP